ncbi:MAG: NACHT domain-containing protein, partial [Cyanobacteria bacterium J06555_13]
MSVIVNLLSSMIYDSIKDLSFFKRHKIESRILAATSEVVEPLLPFLDCEGVTKGRQLRLVETCVEELRPLVEEPKRLFEGSLNGQKIFDELYKEQELPLVILEDGLESVYAVLCPRIATLLCEIPAAVKNWENEAWSENFSRLDEVAHQLRQLFEKIDKLSAAPSQNTDTLLLAVRRTTVQKIIFDLDLTGLRGDSPQKGKFDDFFIHPVLRTELPIESNARRPTHKYKDIAEEGFDTFFLTGKRTVLLGSPGSGKSTLAKWLQRETFSARWTGLCVRVELRKVTTDALPPIHPLIREEASLHHREALTYERTSTWIDSGRVIFIFDGFDEIRPNDRDSIYDWITQLAAVAEQCPLAVTSRPLTTNHLESLCQNWQRWTIQPFDRPRIVNYIERWYRHTPLISGEAQNIDASILASQWMRDPTIGPLTGNPLLLSTLLMVNHLDGSLPSGRSQLYKRYIYGMLGLWDSRRNVISTDIQLNIEDKRRLLKGLALRMFFKETEQIDEYTAVESTQSILQDLGIKLSAVDVLTFLRERSGLIVGPGIYSFSHKSVLEYLVAESVLQGDQRDIDGHRIDRFYLFEHRDDDRWNTVTFLWAGLAPIADVESFIDQCINVNTWDLALGMLYDQYDKLGLPIRRRLLLDLIEKDRIPISDKSTSFWGLSYMTEDSKEVILNIPSFTLRSLSSSHLKLSSLVEKAVGDRTVTWIDGAQSKGKMRDLLWMTCVVNLQVDSIKEWPACVTSRPPNDASERAWLAWVAEHIFEQALTVEDSELLVHTMGLYKSVRSEYQDLIPLVLMAIGLGLFDFPFYDDEEEEEDEEEEDEEFRYEPSTYTYDKFLIVLKVLPNSSDGDIDKDLLLGTQKWAIGSPEGKQIA